MKSMEGTSFYNVYT